MPQSVQSMPGWAVLALIRLQHAIQMVKRQHAAHHGAAPPKLHLLVPAQGIRGEHPLHEGAQSM
ncbi:hypothetical protein SDC9_89314 [bioreactor metagenome]|uniref:Uncharacterized protein n=1 Tax=bioreactor metagenome TaxID=1076179 RepID=A0A644ZPH5_9ZZZZ